MVGLLKDAGYEAFVMDWHNPSRRNDYDPEMQYRPQRVRGADGAECSVLWSHSIAFQKFKNYVQGRMELSHYLDYVFEHCSATSDRMLAVYTNDLEVFDYRPGQPARTSPDSGREFARIRCALEALNSDERLQFLLPSQLLQHYGTLDGAIVLESTEQPVPCKKQLKYNVTRWAVSGRLNVFVNAQCYELLRYVRQAEALLDGAENDTLDSLWVDLCYLWSSDFRTNTTHEKALSFNRRLGAARSRALTLVRELAVSRLGTDSLFNPHEFELDKLPVEIELDGLQPTQFSTSVVVDDVPTQLDGVTRFRDGSVRSGTLVVVPRVAPHSSAAIVTRTGEAPSHAGSRVYRDGADLWVETPACKLQLLGARGGAIGQAAFPSVSDKPLIGTVAQGAYADIRYGADFYSGHMVLFTCGGEKVTDLNPADFELDDDAAQNPVRVPVAAWVNTAFGLVKKTYLVYVDQPRVDLTYELNFPVVNLASLRLGFVTCLPSAFGASPRYATVNGGSTVEDFALGDQAFDHGAPVSMIVSARQCLGATEGWVWIGNKTAGVAVVTDRSTMCAVPMLEYAPQPEGPFLRVSHSAVELDETSANVWRGHYTARFSLLGATGDELAKVRDAAALVQVPPVII